MSGSTADPLVCLELACEVSHGAFLLETEAAVADACDLHSSKNGCASAAPVFGLALWLYWSKDLSKSSPSPEVDEA